MTVGAVVIQLKNETRGEARRIADGMRTVATETQRAEDALRRQTSETQRAEDALRRHTSETQRAQEGMRRQSGEALALAQAFARLKTATGDYASAERTIQSALAGTTTTTRQAIAAKTQLAAIAARAARGTEALRQSEIRAASAAGDHARALRLVDTALAGAAQGTRRYNDLLAQRSRIEQRISRETAQDGQSALLGLSASLGRIGSTLGSFGLAMGGRELVQFGVDAGRAALHLRETKNSLMALAGDVRTYNSVLASARQQQLLFGGTLQENIEGLSGLTITARESGASLQTLIDLSQRLAVKDPTQGIQGARIALAEGLSGDPTSLARRYEIPRAALARLRDTSIPVAERLALIDQYLNRVGITSAAVAGKVDQDALAYRRLNQELGDVVTTVGDGLASGFSRAATGLSRLLGVANNNPQAIAELKALFSGRDVTQQDTDEAARGVAAARARQQLGGARGQPIIATRLGGAEGYNAVTQQLIAINLQGQEAARAADQVTWAWIRSGAGADDLRQRLAVLTAQQSTASTAALDLADRHRAGTTAISAADQQIAEFNSRLAENAAKAQVSAAQSQLLKERQEEIAQASALAAQGLLGAGDQAVLLGQKYGFATAQAQLLINQQQALLRGTAQADFRAGEQSGGAFRTAKERTQTLEIQRQRAQELAEAQRALVMSTGTQAQQIAQVRGELAKLTPGTAEYVRKLTELRALQNASSGRRGPVGGRGVSSLDRAELALVDDLDAKRAALLDKLKRGNLTEVQRLQLLNQIQEVERKIGDQKERQVRSALDARLAMLDDRKKRREEERELARAQRVLGSNASAEFKAAAADVLERIPLEQQKRALEIQKNLREAGQASPSSAPAITASATPRPLGPAAPGAAPLPQLPQLPGIGTAGAGAVPIAVQPPPININLQVLLDGKEIGGQLRAQVQGGVQADLRLTLNQVLSAGVGGR